MGARVPEPEQYKVHSSEFSDLFAHMAKSKHTHTGAGEILSMRISIHAER